MMILATAGPLVQFLIRREKVLLIYFGGSYLHPSKRRKITPPPSIFPLLLTLKFKLLGRSSIPPGHPPQYFDMPLVFRNLKFPNLKNGEGYLHMWNYQHVISNIQLLLLLALFLSVLKQIFICHYHKRN